MHIFYLKDVCISLKCTLRCTYFTENIRPDVPLKIYVGISLKIYVIYINDIKCGRVL